MKKKKPFLLNHLPLPKKQFHAESDGVLLKKPKAASKPSSSTRANADHHD